MPTESVNQAINLLRKASNILILIPGGDNADAVAASLALKEFLIRQEKQARIVSPTAVMEKFKFLPEAGSINGAPSLSKNLVLEISLAKTDLSELRYQKQGDKLAIFLTPKSGQFESSDINIKSSVYPFDALVAIGVSNLDELGEIYAHHAQMFFEIPIVNIDHRPSNENFGQVNAVNLTSSSSSEVVFDLLSDYDANFIDEKIATLLLAGLVAQTNSFQSQKTTPQAFEKASKLVNLGGRQQEIVGRLYKSKSLGLLRLWGRVLARLKHDSENQLVHSVVTVSDVEKSEARPQDLEEIIFEMSQSLGFAKVFVFLAEQAEGSTWVYVAGGANTNWLDVFSAYNPATVSSQAVKFTLAKPINQAEADALAMVRGELARYH